MSCLQGYVTTTYDNLVEVFGQPDKAYEKATVQWVLKKKNNGTIYIYDWKETRTPKGMYEWHIGGTSKNDVNIIELLLNNAVDPDNMQQIKKQILLCE